MDNTPPDRNSLIAPSIIRARYLKSTGHVKCVIFYHAPKNKWAIHNALS